MRIPTSILKQTSESTTKRKPVSQNHIQKAKEIAERLNTSHQVVKIMTSQSKFQNIRKARSNSSL